MSLPAMTPVVSSNVKAVGYDGAAKEMHVQFHSGGHYVYSDVAPAKHAALLAAPSVGSHLHTNFIVSGGHRFRRHA